MNNYAFIDGPNLHMAITEFGWKIDYKRFRIYLAEHYNVVKAYIFMGYRKEEQQMYDFFVSSGFELIFKPVLELKDGQVKGNCDAELVLQAMIDYKRYRKAIIVTGDGDFYCLIKYLQGKGKLQTVLAPTLKNCSSLIRRALKGNFGLISDLRKKIEYRKKPPQDET